MNKLSRPEVIVFISVLPILFMVFVEHDEMFILCLIELGFLLIVGLLYVLLILAVGTIFEIGGKIYASAQKKIRLFKTNNKRDSKDE